MGIKSTPIAAIIPFDNSSNGFTADNVQDAIEEASSGGGGSSSFSKQIITSSVTVPTNEQMVIVGAIVVQGGSLTLNGTLGIV